MSKPASIYMIERTIKGEKMYWENESRMWTTLEGGDAVGVKLIGDILTSAIENSGPDFRIIELVLPDDITPTQTSPSPDPERRPEVEKVMLAALLAAKAVLGRMCTNWDEFTKVRDAVELAKENPALKKESYRGVIETTFSDEGKTERITIQFPKGNRPPFSVDWTIDPCRQHPWYKKSVTVTIED
jgi:hypothetical protein